MNLATLKDWITEAGFDDFGITKAQISEEDKTNIESYIHKGFHSTMKWFPDRQEIRLHFKNLGFAVQSVLVLIAIYKPRPEDEEAMLELSSSISKYAWGSDYHDVLKKSGKSILNNLRTSFPGKKFRQAVDSVPIPEKILARNSGIGWIGKNTLLIHPELGSYFFITSILSEVDLAQELEPSERSQLELISKDRCGSCRKCIDACPTQAIIAPYQLDAGKCISHHTIEYKDGTFPPNYKTSGWLFGCDVCQDVCPWNAVKARKRGVVTKFTEFHPLPIWNKSKEELEEISEEDFDSGFASSPVKRTGWKNWKRNWDQKNLESQSERFTE